MKYSYSSSSISIPISISISISKNMSLLLSDLSLRIEYLSSGVVKDICSRNGLSYDIEWSHIERLLKGGDVSVSKSVSSRVSSNVSSNVSCDSRVALPFSGEMYNDKCRGLKYNNGLMTQCRVRISGVGCGVDELKYCKTCENQSKKNVHGKPTYGTIIERLRCDIYDYVAPNGERPISYVSVMSKLNLSKECVLEESKRCGQKIDERHFDSNEGIVPEKRRRGRPKSNANNDCDKSVVKGRRGRPKKDSKVLELSGGDDLLGALVGDSVAEQVVELDCVPVWCSDTEIVLDSVVESDAEIVLDSVTKQDAEIILDSVVESDAEIVLDSVTKQDAEIILDSVAEQDAEIILDSVTKQDAEIILDSVAEQDAEIILDSVAELDTINEEDNEEDNEEEETDVVIRVDIDNKKYLKSKKSGVIYDASSHEEIGVWNEKTQAIDYYTGDNEEEEYEEYEDE